jgi:hypothetical protein
VSFEVFLGKLDNVFLLDGHDLCTVNSHDLRPFLLYALQSADIHLEQRQRLGLSKVRVEQAHVHTGFDRLI